MAFGLAFTAVLVVSGVAFAYQERTPSARLATPSNTGCIQVYSALGHGNASAPMTVHIEAAVPGRTRQSAQLCLNDWPVGTTTALAGQPVGYVIKLIRSGVFRDNYSLCRAETSGLLSLTSRLNFDVTYPTPPCGAGYYALVACMNNVTTAARPPGSPAVITGTYNATGVTASQCNVSPFWHPAGVGDSVTPGAAVRL
jgi:hypothetical protein